MNQNKLSARLRQIIKSAAAAAVLPVLFIYIMIAKPDYAIMNGLGHIVLPVANWVGDVITWPVRAVGAGIDNIRELSNLRTENAELRAQLADALRDQGICHVAVAENKKLTQELDLVASQPRNAVVADITYDNTAFHHSTFFINKGAKHGLSPVRNGRSLVPADKAGARGEPRTERAHDDALSLRGRQFGIFRKYVNIDISAEVLNQPFLQGCLQTKTVGADQRAGKQTARLLHLFNVNHKKYGQKSQLVS